MLCLGTAAPQLPIFMDFMLTVILQNVSFQTITHFQNGMITPEPVTKDAPPASLHPVDPPLQAKARWFVP